MTFEQQTSKSSPLKLVFNVFLMSILYFVLAYAALQFARIPGNTSVFWIPTGFAIALLINYGSIYGLSLIFGKLLLGFVSNSPIDQSLISILASVSEAYVGLYLFNSFNKSIEEHFDYQSDLILISTISFFAPVISAMIGVTNLLYHGLIPENQYFFNWIGWYTGDVLGAFIFLPAFIFSHLKSSEDEPKFQMIDFILPILTAAFTYLFRFDVLNPYIFMLFFTILVPAVLGNGRALFYSLITISITLNFFLVKHIGPFSTGNYQDNLTSMQFFLFAIGFTALGLEGFKRTGLIKRAILPLVSFWIMTGGIYYYYHIQQDNTDRKNLNNTISEFANRLSEKLIFLKNSMYGVAGFVSSSHEVNQNEWNAYIRSVSLINYKNGIHSVSLIHQNNSKKEDLVYYDNKGPSRNSFKDKKIFQTDVINQAMKESNRTGETIITPPIPISLNNENKLISYIVLPFYKNETFVGWIVSTIEIKNIINSMIENEFQNIDIDVYTGKERLPEKKIFQQIIDSRFRTNEFDPEKVSSIQIAGQTYTIYWNETSRFISQHSSQNSFFVLLGAVFSLFVVGFILNLRLINEKAEKLADLKNRELSESEGKFKGLFNNSSDAVVIFNEQRIIDCNPVSLSIFGKSTKKEMMLNLFPIHFLHKNDVSLFDTKMKEAKIEGMIFFECQCLRDDIPFIAEVHLHHFVLKERYVYQAVVRDISERKKIETNLIKSKELAEEAARAKSNFLSTMSHEIRTPLNGVIGMIDYLIDENQNSPLKNDLNTIKYSADNLLHVLNEVLDFNKIEAGKMIMEKKIFSLKNMCMNLFSIYHLKAQSKNIAFNLDFDEALPQFIIGDEYRNSQILHNLINNALKFTDQGRVDLKITMVSKNEDYCQINFKVSDTGIGINENKMRVIFEEFTQAESDHSRKYGGTGLGLSICKKLIEIQKGSLEYESVVNEGSIFSYTLTFALPDQKEIPANDVLDNFESMNFQGKNVLLVEDNDVNIIVTKKFLEKWGFSVGIAMNGIEAIEKTKSNSYDLILMDLHMPIMGGLEATQTIREFNKTIPIIGLSADVMTDSSYEFQKTGMNHFVSKPFIPDEFLKKIRSVLIYS